MAKASITVDRLLKRLSRGMQALLLALVALGATALLWTATLIHSTTLKEFLNAVATGLLVSAAFGIAQALVTSRVAAELLRTSVVEEVSHSLAQANNAYYPANEFPASTTPDPLFNALLAEDLRNSSTFWFRGLSGRYAAARLSFNQNVALQAHFILPDPKVQGTTDGRVDYAYRNQIYPGLSIDDIRNKIRSDIALGVAGLLEACRKCGLFELILTPMPLLDRYEIFRDAVWVTLYSDPGQGTNFPRTLRFPASSIMYLMQQADCIQVRAHPNARVIPFPRAAAPDDLLKLFEDITGEPVTQDEYQRLKGEFTKFADDFARTAGLRRAR